MKMSLTIYGVVGKIKSLDEMKVMSALDLSGKNGNNSEWSGLQTNNQNESNDCGFRIVDVMMPGV